MKVAIITPHYVPAVRGNAVTVRRIQRQLSECGCEVRVYSLDTMSACDILAAVKTDPPDIIHAFHGYFGGRVARIVSGTIGVPYLVTLTGSDVYETLDDARRNDTASALDGASAVVAFDCCINSQLLGRLPHLRDKLSVIPQGVELPGTALVCQGEHCFDEGEFVFFLPAGLRRVKNVLFPLSSLATLHGEFPQIRFVLGGPVIDTQYAARVLAELERYPFAHFVGEISHSAIGWYYQRADVVLNTSIFEGGMANSLLEALAFGRPVLASAIEGNRSLVRDGETGLLYIDEEEFLEKAGLLLRDSQLRYTLGENGARFVRDNFSSRKEAESYLELYGKIAAVPKDN